jgi:uncharacterized protein involved in type VI secretion and phage assembly
MIGIQLRKASYSFGGTALVRSAPAFSLQVGPHAASSLVVTRFSGSESPSRLYDFRVEFFEKDEQLLELAELPGTQAQLTLQAGETPVRYVHGLFRPTAFKVFSSGGPAGERTGQQAEGCRRSTK